MTDDVDRSDELREWYAEDERREAAGNNCQHPDGQAAPRRARVTWANSITPERVTWAWVGDPFGSPQDAVEDSEHPRNGSRDVQNLRGGSEGRIAAGTIAVAAGPEGVGKSSFAIWMAVRVSTGTLLGAWYGRPRRVLYCTIEDSWRHTVVSRLIAAGADLSMVGRFDVVSETDNVLTISLPADNRLLTGSITEENAALVVLDPLLSMISDRLDSHHERETRVALDPLVKIADTTGAVILGIAHWNKGTGTDATTRITGSGAFKNVPRAVFAFARDPDAEDEFVMTQTKNSLGRYGLPSIRYRMETAPVEHNGELIDFTGRFTPIGVSAKTVTDILSARDTDTADFTPAQRFLLAYVAGHGDQDSEVPCAEVFGAGEPVGYQERDLIKARNKIKHLVGTRKDGMKGGWVWFLTDHPDNDPLKPEARDE